MTRLAIVIAVYFAVQAAALALTRSGDWGMGWIAPEEAQSELMILGSTFMAAVVVSAWSLGRARMAQAVRTIGTMRIVLALIALAIVGTLASPDLREYAEGLLLTAMVSVAALGLLVAAGLAIPAGAAGRLATWIAVPRPRLAWCAAAWVIVVSAALSWVVLERVPHVPDEVAYWFQARYFEAGHLYVSAPPDQAAFELPHTLVADGKWFSIFPPGWPAVLAAGMAVGLPWLVNPLLGGAAVLLLHALVSTMHSRSTADLAAVLLAVSPMFLLMSAGMMSHPLALTLALAALLGWWRGVEGSSAGWTAGGAVALGGLVLTRPIEGALLGLLLAGWGGWIAITRRVDRAPLRVVSFLTLAVLCGSTMLLYNRALTGRALYDPITMYFDERYYPGSNRLGFGPDVGNTGWQNDLRAGHSPFEAALNSHRNGYLLNLELFGWTCGSLVGIVAFTLFGAWSRADAFLASLAVVVVAGLGFYWYAGADYGPRYWYLLVAPLSILTARGITTLAALVPAPDNIARGRLATAVATAAAAAVLLFLPWRAATKYHHYRGMGAAVVDLARSGGLGSALIFVRGAGPGTPFSRYSAAGMLNPVPLGSPGPVFARDVDGDRRRRVECAFAGRPVRTIDTSALPAGPVVLSDALPAPACSGASAGGASR